MFLSEAAAGSEPLESQLSMGMHPGTTPGCVSFGRPCRSGRVGSGGQRFCTLVGRRIHPASPALRLQQICRCHRSAEPQRSPVGHCCRDPPTPLPPPGRCSPAGTGCAGRPGCGGAGAQQPREGGDRTEGRLHDRQGTSAPPWPEAVPPPPPKAWTNPATLRRMTWP